jgi:diguanylate cyclase (GGDEF)-like protein
VVVVLVPSLAAVAFIGFRGMESGRSGVNNLYADHLVTLRTASALEIGLDQADIDSLQLLAPINPANRGRITTDLAADVSPRVDSAISLVKGDSADDPLERPQAAVIAKGWSTFQALSTGGALDATTLTARQATGRQLATIFQATTSAAQSIVETESQQAAAAHIQALASYRSHVRWMLLTVLLAVLAVAGVVGWLIRSVLPRTLQYSAFAADVTHGDYTRRLDPTGNDELADLGRTLDDLAQRRQVEVLFDHRQYELTDTLQVAETEQEAHDLVKRHLERSVRQSTVTVLNRNNSADRLQAVTVVPLDSPLAHGLDAAKPRSCLAVRMTRPHHGTYGEETLLACPVCSQCPGRTTCTPLLVGGEVIGSILADHQLPLDDHEQRSIREVVIQAAPVLGNLRNLAIAELRAATDSLTGLPNKRALETSIKRMVAQAAQSGSPLTALMCDLDHFKTINDRFGHGRGDEVLAAVGAVFTETLRPGDFAGRYGGEEFLILLPGTDRESGAIVAERIRDRVAVIRVPTVDQLITLSIGLAVMPEHALDSDTLVRAADRALYSAKKGGRNRVEISSPRTQPAGKDTMPDEQADIAVVVLANGSSS